MSISPSHILMMEALLDDELNEEDVQKIKEAMLAYPELHQLYTILKSQKAAIKSAFLLDAQTH